MGVHIHGGVGVGLVWVLGSHLQLPYLLCQLSSLCSVFPSLFNDSITVHPVSQSYPPPSPAPTPLTSLPIFIPISRVGGAGALNAISVACWNADWHCWLDLEWAAIAAANS